MIAGREDYNIACPTCGETSERNPVPSHIGILIVGGPNQPMPPKDNMSAIQEETHKIVKKAGWTTERAVDEMRKNMTTDEKDVHSFNPQKLTKRARQTDGAPV